MPFKTDSQIPSYLIDFIQNDPNFVPDIHCNNLEDVFLNFHTDEPTHPSSHYSKLFGKYKTSVSKRNLLMNPYENQSESSSETTSIMDSSRVYKDIEKKTSKRDQSKVADNSIVIEKKETGGRIRFKT